MAKIIIKSLAEIEQVKQACQIVTWVLAEVGQAIKPGLTTEYLDKLAEKLIRQKKAEPIFIGYRGYRHAICVSVNNEIVHGVPGPRIINEGDIVGVDIGARLNGWCGDNAATFPVGQVANKLAKLLRAGKKALQAGIKQVRAGSHLGDISAAIERVSKDAGFSAVRDLYGHGIGRDLHEEPLIPNIGQPGEGPELKPGMILCIEPMLNTGTWKIKTLADGWTVVTEDGGCSCHFEHTVLVTDGDPEILTLLRSPSASFGGQAKIW